MQCYVSTETQSVLFFIITGALKVCPPTSTVAPALCHPSTSAYLWHWHENTGKKQVHRYAGNFSKGLIWPFVSCNGTTAHRKARRIYFAAPWRCACMCAENYCILFVCTVGVWQRIHISLVEDHLFIVTVHAHTHPPTHPPTHTRTH